MAPNSPCFPTPSPADALLLHRVSVQMGRVPVLGAGVVTMAQRLLAVGAAGDAEMLKTKCKRTFAFVELLCMCASGCQLLLLDLQLFSGHPGGQLSTPQAF